MPVPGIPSDVGRAQLNAAGAGRDRFPSVPASCPSSRIAVSALSGAIAETVSRPPARRPEEPKETAAIAVAATSPTTAAATAAAAAAAAAAVSVVRVLASSAAIALAAEVGCCSCCQACWALRGKLSGQLSDTSKLRLNAARFGDETPTVDIASSSTSLEGPPSSPSWTMRPAGPSTSAHVGTASSVGSSRTGWPCEGSPAGELDERVASRSPTCVSSAAAAAAAAPSSTAVADDDGAAAAAAAAPSAGSI